MNSDRERTRPFCFFRFHSFCGRQCDSALLEQALLCRLSASWRSGALLTGTDHSPVGQLNKTLFQFKYFSSSWRFRCCFWRLLSKNAQLEQANWTKASRVSGPLRMLPPSLFGWPAWIGSALFLTSRGYSLLAAESSRSLETAGLKEC